MVGVNKYVRENEKVDIPIVEIDDSVETEQLKRLADVKRRRDSRHVSECLNNLKGACQRGENVMPYCIEAVKSLATVRSTMYTGMFMANTMIQEYTKNSFGR